MYCLADTLSTAKIVISILDQKSSVNISSEDILTNLSNAIHFILGFIFLTSSLHIIALFFPICFF